MPTGHEAVHSVFDPAWDELQVEAPEQSDSGELFNALSRCVPLEQILEMLLREGEQEEVFAKAGLRPRYRHLVAEFVQSLQAKRLDRRQEVAQGVNGTKRNKQALSFASFLSHLFSVGCMVPLFDRCLK